MSSRARWLVVILGVLTLVTAAAAWRAPVGAGEYRVSPDKTVTAEVNDLSRGTFAGRERYLQVRLQRVDNDQVLYEKEFLVPDGSAVPDYTDRQRRHVNWSEDSRRVSIEVLDGRRIDVVVP